MLLIACANVASLLLARTETRRGELAMQSALGARPGRLVQAAMAEGVVRSPAEHSAYRSRTRRWARSSPRIRTACPESPLSALIPL